MLRTLTRATLALATLCALGACNKEEAADTEPLATDSTAATAVEAELATWDVRLDEAGDAGGFQMTEEPGGGWVVKTGPTGSAITWRDQDMVESGAFRVSAAMEERAAPADHREGYGLFVGGRNLQQPDQQYTYFLVRGSGDYLIKRRDGEATPTLVDWTAAPSIKKVANAGDATQNALEIRVEPEVTRFFVNGTEVTTLPTEQVQPYGIAGMRINHALDMRVTAFEAGAGDAAPATTQPAPADSLEATPR
jgi:hypothetical protein